MYKKLPTHRYKKTLEMLKEVCPAPAVIFDLGVRNPFSEIMKQNNYKVYNTGGEDFDDNPQVCLIYQVVKILRLGGLIAYPT